MMKTENKTIAITGAGSGFGAAIADRYAALGWQVAITDIDYDRAELTLAALANKYPRFSGFAMHLDVTSIEDWQALAVRIQREWPGLGTLVNNAGVATGGNLQESSLEDWEWVLKIDLLGVVYGCKQFVELFKQQGSGHIVNMSSFAALAGAPGVVSYGVAKAGVVALSEALRAELYPYGVGVTVVCPAFVKTGLLDNFRSADSRDKARVARWMENSGVSAEDVARQLAAAVARKQFLLLTHANTRWLWRLKRWWPERYFKLLVKARTGSASGHKT